MLPYNGKLTVCKTTVHAFHTLYSLHAAVYIGGSWVVEKEGGGFDPD